ncbi:adenine deaminase C-terminal domain-containing protein [Fervidibacillus halotolerans]|uniref:adenine deaminase n=1 Tax=Fervidibacillus halotolerans TaxID=2980027 RepID=A0A9E8RXB3_9BACI|nr:adenine deaminase C-terminal domain-containing protein [Fervidibacillus halotolerans]WAA12600.1 amidohydrolase family protein [Fervidibacillus halotolerans]
MFELQTVWKNKQIREQVDVLNGKRSPTKLLYNATYLHGILKKWMKGNIWIYGDRIVYVGEKRPELIDESCEQIDCSQYFLVPGYIEPHAHPFQLYNPQTFAQYASQRGTSVLINDNLFLFLQNDKKKAFALIENLQKMPTSLFWWSRFDSQTELIGEETIFSNSHVKAWLEHDLVVQGGELTGWPKLLEGNNMILHWMQLAKKWHKKVEGHFPGASEKTLAKMKLFGADSDHEAMTGEEVKNRLMHGYTVSLRHSSIRPDLPKLLNEIKELGPNVYQSLMLTTDGSSPSFYEDGVIDRLIKIAIEHGVPEIDAYLMATLNPAKYFQLDHMYGLIATGRVANINFLKHKNDPRPISCLAKGKWVRRDNQPVDEMAPIQWEQYGFSPLSIEWDLSIDDLQFSMPIGIEMKNAVITKPYSISTNVSCEQLDPLSEESFFMLADKEGKWRVNTIVKGFVKNIGGFVSSFSSTGDILLIGKNKQDLLNAFKRMKELGGGIVLYDKGERIYELPLPLNGLFSNERFESLIEREKELKSILQQRGYPFEDPIYSLLFFSATHLPYIRITQKGLFDVMKKRVLFPSIMR